jgi:hypothetical protein
VIFAGVIVAALVGDSFFPPQQMSPGADTAIIGKCLEIAIAIVSIIVPLLILVIEFYGREAGVTDLIIWRAGVLRHVFLVLATLLFVALAYARSAAYQAHYKDYFPSAIVSGSLALTLGVVAETAWFARRTIVSLKNEAIYDALEQRLAVQLRKSIDHELDHRLGRRTVEKLARQYAVLISPIGRYVARQEVALTADTSGVVTDIRLDKLESFCAGVTTTMSGKEVKAYLTRSLHDQVQQGQPVAYVPRTEQVPHRLEKTLRSALIVTPARPRGPDLKPTLDHLKDMTVRAIQDLSEGAFERLLSLYMSVAAFHTELVSATGSEAPPPASIADLFAEWPFVRFLERDLDVIIEDAVRSPSRVFIHRTADLLYYLAVHALHRKDARIFRFATELFQAMYRHAHRAHDARGKDLVYLYVAQQLADLVLVPMLNETPPEPERVNEAKNYLRLLTGAIVALAKMSVDAKDKDFFIKMVGAGEEMLTYYHPAPGLWQDQYRSLTKIHESAPGTEERERALQKQEAVEFLTNLNSNHEQEWRETIFVIGAYVVNGRDQGVLDDDLSRGLVHTLLPKFADLHELFSAFSSAMCNQYGWVMFDRMPTTKRVGFIDTEGKYYLFYSLVGIRLAGVAGIPETPLQSESFARHDVDRIKASCEHIVKNARKWSWLTRTPVQQVANDFVSFNEQIVTAREARQEASVVKSDLCKDTLALFAERAVAAAQGTSALRYWLEEYEALSEVEELPTEDRETISRGALEEKATFVGNEFSGVAAQLGTFMGEAVASAFDSCILQRLLRTAKDAARPRAMALADAMPAACHWLEGTSSSAGLIVVPVQTTATALHALPGFLYPEAIDDGRPSRMVHGFYGAIPILAVRDDIVGENILAIDLARACRVVLTPPLTEVRTLDDQEIQDMTKKDPKLTERILRLRVWARAWQYFKLERIGSEGLVVVELAGDL